MLYEQSLAIERRLGRLVRLIRSGQHSTPVLAGKLGVSVPTVSRDILALRQRGYTIESGKLARSWAYKLVSSPSRACRSQRLTRVSS